MTDSKPETSNSNLVARLSQWAGAAVLSLLSVLGGAYTWNSGYLDAALPQARVADPIAIEIVAPREILAGQSYPVFLVIKGAHGIPVWLVSPADSGVLTLEAQAERGQLKFDEPGNYTIHVSVAGAAMHATSALHMLTVFDAGPLTTTPEGPQSPTPSASHSASHSVQQQVSPLSIASQVMDAAADVHTDNKAVEARTLAGCFRSVIGQIQTGILPPDTDPLAIVESQAETALGEKAPNWNLFLGQVRAIFGELRDAGEITTAATSVRYLGDVAAVLREIR